MAVAFELVEEDDCEVFPDEPSKPKRDQQPQCSCGRFAKFVGVRNYYNGNYDCSTLSVDCKRCGPVDIELV